MIMVSLRIIKYCYDSPMENEIETVWSQNNIIFKASPPLFKLIFWIRIFGSEKKSELGTQTMD